MPNFCNKRNFSTILILLLLTLLIVQPVSGIVILEYFHQQGCINCEKVDPLIDTIRTQYGNRVTVEKGEIDDSSGVRLLMSYGVTEIPIIVINHNKVLTYPYITRERLDAEIGLAESGFIKSWNNGAFVFVKQEKYEKAAKAYQNALYYAQRQTDPQGTRNFVFETVF